MAKLCNTGSPEAHDVDSDIDSISITSTILSEQKDEYPLEAILAEEKFKGVTKYLVKWEGYSEHRCTWETRSMFQDGLEITFHDWETQKMRIGRGETQPFDVAAFKKRVNTWLDGVEKRRLRRRAKRERLGLSVAPLKVERQEESSDSQAEEVEEAEPKALERRLNLKRKASLSAESVDNSLDSEAVETDSSNESASRSQWTSHHESSLLDGLEHCKRPDWDLIRRMDYDVFKKFRPSDLEAQARRIIASFHESGKDVPQYLQAVESKLLALQAREEENGRQGKGVSGKSTVSNGYSGSETDDSLVEEFRAKEAKKRRKMRQPGSNNQNDKAKGKSKTQSREASRSESVHSAAQAVDLTNNKTKSHQTATSRSGSNTLGILPNFKKKPVTDEQGGQKTARTTSRSATSQPTLPARPNVTATPTPTTGAPKPGNDKSQAKPLSQMGGIGRGPRRQPPANVFIANPPKRYATGAAIFGNWNTANKPHGNSSLATKSGEVAENPKAYDKLSIRRRAIKKGRTEPVPNIANLQLIDPKDGKAVKKVPVAVAAATTDKSAFELIRESRENAEKDDVETLANVEHDDGASLAAVEEEVAAKTGDRPKSVAPIVPAMSSRVTDARVESKGHATSSANGIKKTSLTLQDYRKKIEASSEQTSNETPINGLTAPRLSSPTTATFPDAPINQKAKVSSPDPASNKSAGQSFPRTSSAALPPNRTYPHAIALPQLPAHPVVASPHEEIQDTNFTIPTEAPPATPESLGASKAVLTYNGPSLSGALSAPRAMMQAGPSVVSDVPVTTEAVSAPEPHGAVWQHEKDEVYGSLLFGADRTEIGPVRFRAFDYASRKRLISNRTGPKENLFWFSSMCTAADYEAYFHTGPSDTLFSPGHIVPYLYNHENVKEISETLRIHVSGGLFLGTKYSLLVYPIGSEDWTFLDKDFPNVPPVGLRCCIRAPIQRQTMDRMHDKMGTFKKRRDKRGLEITCNPENLTINIVMRNLYNIDYVRLAGSHQIPKFFLIFPKERKTEQDLILQFLDANGAAEVHIYDENKNDGIWNYFSRKVKRDEKDGDGIIIVHLAFWRFHNIPNFANCMSRNFVVWGLGLRKTDRISHSHLVRLFPHGCLLLITDSLILLQPLETLRILLWFRLRVLEKKVDRTWKIITRPNIRRFLSNCSRERRLDEEGKRFIQMYEQIAYMLDPDDLYDWDEQEPKEEAPIYCMKKIRSFDTKVGGRVDFNRDLDHAAIAKNDDVLAEFFAGWANVHSEEYRRFHIISGFDGDEGKAQQERWMKKWSHCEVFTPNNFYVQNRIPPQATLDEEAVSKHNVVMQKLRHRLEEIDAAVKADEAERKDRMAQSEKEWQVRLDRHLGLKEIYESLMNSGVMEELPHLAEESTKDRQDDDDGWSNDGSSATSFDMIEVGGDGDGDEVLKDVCSDEGSKSDNCVFSCSDGSSESDSE